MKCKHYKQNPKDHYHFYCDCGGKLHGPAPGWKDVREELPGIPNNYYCFNAMAGEQEDGKYNDIVWWDGNKFSQHVTHWQPLLAPPEGVQG